MAISGTIDYEIDVALELEIDFRFTPGSPARITMDPLNSYPGEDPEYEIEAIRAKRNEKWYDVPEWLFDILSSEYEEDIYSEVDEWLDDRR